MLKIDCSRYRYYRSINQSINQSAVILYIVHDFNYTLSGTTINRTDNIKDLGVIFDSKLKFCKHIDDKVNKAYQNLGIIKRNFIHLTANCLYFYIKV